MTGKDTGEAPGRRIRQRRGKKTYDALIATGFKLLEEREFDSITIAELARAAGYSVGAFYSRFRSKDEFLEALIAKHMVQRTRARDKVIAKATRDSLIGDLIKDLVSYYWRRRLFWRAALYRGMRDPNFWKPITAQGEDTHRAVIEEITARAGRPLTETEVMHIRFAYHLTLGAVNNSIVNRPGPILFHGREHFIENLTRAFRLVSGYDEIVRASATRLVG